MIGAGRKNKLITIHKLTETVTDQGETTESAEVIAQTWAAIEPLNAREQWYAKQTQATTTHRITLWHIPDITSRMRALWNNRTFNFDSVINADERNREWIIEATEVTE